ncbi:MAG: type II toxin-antitoxin system HicA family toxin [Acidobacteriales bacterium]|nr:type II toxin-antitoxin system HicA family toxin [Terriglobales bacterium]
MAPLKPLPFGEVRRKLETAGWTVVGQRGSHVKFLKRFADGSTRTTTVPNHREVRVGTLAGIIRQTGMTVELFVSL